MHVDGRIDMRPSTLVPHAYFWEWQEAAKCRGEDPAIFFAVDGERGQDTVNRLRRAKAICSGCQVVEACLRYSMKHDEEFGIWGGLGERERKALGQKMRFRRVHKARR